MSDSEGIRYWLALTRIKRLHRATVMKLIERHGGAEALFARGASVDAPPSVLRALNEFRDWAWVESEIELADEKGVMLIAYDDPQYPALLRKIPDPPYLLYARGKVYDADARRAIAVEGTRNPTSGGVEMARTISATLARAGFAVVSGMARGCDAYVHRGALSSGGFTVAVLGTGVDVPYPGSNVSLYGEIVEKGLVVSEFALGAPPAPENFLRRNRIISGISSGVVVIEASLRSGSLMTARLASECGKKVFVLKTMKGSLAAGKLLERGAVMVEDASEIVRMMGQGEAKTRPGRFSP